MSISGSGSGAGAAAELNSLLFTARWYRPCLSVALFADAAGLAISGPRCCEGAKSGWSGSAFGRPA